MDDHRHAARWERKLIHRLLPQVTTLWATHHAAQPGVVVVLTTSVPGSASHPVLSWCPRASEAMEQVARYVPDRAAFLAHLDATPATVPLVVLVCDQRVTLYRLEQPDAAIALTA